MEDRFIEISTREEAHDYASQLILDYNIFHKDIENDRFIDTMDLTLSFTKVLLAEVIYQYKKHFPDKTYNFAVFSVLNLPLTTIQSFISLDRTSPSLLKGTQELKWNTDRCHQILQMAFYKAPITEHVFIDCEESIKRLLNPKEEIKDVDQFKAVEIKNEVSTLVD